MDTNPDVAAICERLTATPTEFPIQPVHDITIDGLLVCTFGAWPADKCKQYVAEVLYKKGYRSDQPASSAVEAGSCLRAPS